MADDIFYNVDGDRRNGNFDVPQSYSVDEQYFSRADMFQAFAKLLVAYEKKNKFPDEIVIMELLGPTDTPLSLAFNGRGMDVPFNILPAQCVMKTVGRLVSEMDDRIPGVIHLHGRETMRDEPFVACLNMAAHLPLLDLIMNSERNRSKAVLNPLEFVYLMAQELHHIRKEGKPRPVLFKPMSIRPAGSTITGAVDRQGLPYTTQEWVSRLQDFTSKPLAMKDRRWADKTTEQSCRCITVEGVEARNAHLAQLEKDGRREPIYLDFHLPFVYDLYNVEAAHAARRLAEMFHERGVKWGPTEITYGAFKIWASVPGVVETIRKYDMPLSYNPGISTRLIARRPAIENMRFDEAVEAVKELHSHDFDFTTGELLPALGGYSFIKERLGKPIPIGAIHGGGFAGPQRYAYLEMSEGVVEKPERTVKGYRTQFLPNLVSSQITMGTPSGNRTIWEDKQLPVVPAKILQKLVDELPRDRDHFISIALHGFNFVNSRSAGNAAHLGRPPVMPFPAPVYPEEVAVKLWNTFETLLTFCVDCPEIEVVWPETERLPYGSGRPGAAADPQFQMVTKAELQRTADSIVSEWMGKTQPPKSGNLSFQQAFTSLVFALASHRNKGVLPETMKIPQVPGSRPGLGPARGVSGRTEELLAHPNPWLQKYGRARSPLTEYSLGSQAMGLRFPSPVSYYAPALIDGKLVYEKACEWSKQVVGRMPESVRLAREETELNSYEFTFLMAQVYRNLMERSEPGMVMKIRFSVPSRTPRRR